LGFGVCRYYQRRTKKSLLGKAAAMIVPIEWEEPLGFVVAEALACGTPGDFRPLGALPDCAFRE